MKCYNHVVTIIEATFDYNFPSDRVPTLGILLPILVFRTVYEDTT